MESQCEQVSDKNIVSYMANCLVPIEYSVAKTAQITKWDIHDLSGQEKRLELRIHEFEKVGAEFFQQKAEFEDYWHKAKQEISKKKQQLKQLEHEFRDHEGKLKEAVKMQVQERTNVDRQKQVNEQDRAAIIEKQADIE